VKLARKGLPRRDRDDSPLDPKGSGGRVVIRWAKTQSQRFADGEEADRLQA
jgi:hypothetical protein